MHTIHENHTGTHYIEVATWCSLYRKAHWGAYIFEKHRLVEKINIIDFFIIWVHVSGAQWLIV
jgi:hypothetical protein